MIRQSITDQMKDAMRARDTVKLETLRYLLSQIKYVEINTRKELTDDEIIDVVSKEVKKRDEAIALFKSSGRDGLVAEEEVKLAVIKSFLPTQLTEAEITAFVDQAVGEVGASDFGSVMRVLMPKVKGKADGKLVSEIVKRKLMA